MTRREFVVVAAVATAASVSPGGFAAVMWHESKFGEKVR